MWMPFPTATLPSAILATTGTARNKEQMPNNRAPESTRVISVSAGAAPSLLDSRFRAPRAYHNPPSSERLIGLRSHQWRDPLHDIWLQIPSAHGVVRPVEVVLGLQGLGVDLGLIAADPFGYVRARHHLPGAEQLLLALPSDVHGGDRQARHGVEVRSSHHHVSRVGAPHVERVGRISVLLQGVEADSAVIGAAEQDKQGLKRDEFRHFLLPQEKKRAGLEG